MDSYLNLSGLWTDLRFLSFQVLPIAFSEMIRWLYEWQILEAGILVLIAAFVWRQGLVRAARITAAVRQRQAQEALEEREPRPVPERGVPDVARACRTEELLALRERIRITLGRVPCVDEPLTVEQLRLCRRSGDFDVEAGILGDGEAVRSHCGRLYAELGGLAALDRSTSCRSAWQALVLVSRAARALGALLEEADSRPAMANVTAFPGSRGRRDGPVGSS